MSGGPPAARADGGEARVRAEEAGGLRWTARALLVQKAGNAPEEMEDASFPSREAEGVASGARFAVADGATETSFSGLWASTLVRLHGRVGLAAETLLDGLPRWGRYWRRRVGDRDLPWYAEEKLRSGSFAAFAGLTLGAPADGAPGAGGGRLRWEAVAAGDSCVFQVREDALMAAFPLELGGGVRQPPRAALHRAGGERRAGVAHPPGGRGVPGRRYLLSDDRRAGGLVPRRRAGRAPLADPGRPVGRLPGREPPAGAAEARAGEGDGAGDGAGDAAGPFRAWVDAARRERRMRNDDVALLRVALW